MTQNSPSSFDQLIRAVGTLAILGSALYLIVFRPEASPTDRWAHDTVTLVLGYWLRSQSRAR